VLALALGNDAEVAAQAANNPQPAAVEPAQAPAPAPTQAPAGSDAPAEAKEPPTPPHTGLRALGRGLVGDIKHLPATENLYLVLAGGALAVAARPVDRDFNAHLRSHYHAVNAVFAPAKYFGNTPEQAALSLGTYAYGRIAHHPKVSHLGMDLLRAQIITEMLVQPIKFATGRERPDGSDSRSFPSGHAAVTFAGATVLERHLGWRSSFVAYAVATYVAASRLHDNRHYLSDVAFGAAVGTIAGRTVTQHGQDNWSVVPIDVPGGVAILAMRTGF
jgi:membrane-associated phospholipid phosphatase